MTRRCELGIRSLLRFKRHLYGCRTFLEDGQTCSRAAISASWSRLLEHRPASRRSVTLGTIRNEADRHGGWSVAADRTRRDGTDAARRSRGVRRVTSDPAGGRIVDDDQDRVVSRRRPGARPPRRGLRPRPAACQPIAGSAVIDRRHGAAGATYGIGFALRCPRTGMADSCSKVAADSMGPSRRPRRLGRRRPLALARGFAVVSTDTGHEGTGAFDGSFMGPAGESRLRSWPSVASRR